jgi:hypothetical protein
MRESHMTNEPVPPTDYAAVLSDLQDTSRYGDLVLSLRSDHRLHPLVEWHLGHLLCSPHAGHLHVQAEKYGISNGRIDLVAYEGTRTVIHFELIASNSGGLHVFRDTTSLLGSNADAKLAILIDEDLDADVYKTYKRAIPSPAVIEDVPLRMVLLKNKEAAFNDLLQRLLDRAAFVAGVCGWTASAANLTRMSFDHCPRLLFAIETRQEIPVCVFVCVTSMTSWI